jgi:hypothetical protein
MFLSFGSGDGEGETAKRQAIAIVEGPKPLELADEPRERVVVVYRHGKLLLSVTKELNCSPPSH